MTGFKKDDSSLGRINILSIKPPQTVTSLKTCIAKKEGLQSVNVQLLENIFSEKPIGDGTISFFGASYPGQQEDQPMAVIGNIPHHPSTTSSWRVLRPHRLREEGLSAVLSSGH